MKRALKIGGAVVLVLGLVLGFVGWSMFGANKPAQDREAAGSGMSVLDGFVQSFVLYAGDKQIVLIDAGNDPEAKAIKAELQRRELAPESVRAIFLTHAHGDHLAGVAAFPFARVYALREEVDLVEGRSEFRSPISWIHAGSRKTARVTDVLTDGARVEIGDLEIRAFHLPGHTPGSAAYLVNGVLYLGDSATAGRDGTLRPAPWLFSEDTDKNRAALRQLAQRLEGEDVRTLAFSHSGQLEGFEPLRAFGVEDTPSTASPSMY